LGRPVYPIAGTFVSALRLGGGSDGPVLPVRFYAGGEPAITLLGYW
jgi:hypothetical protein